MRENRLVALVIVAPIWQDKDIELIFPALCQRSDVCVCMVGIARLSVTSMPFFCQFFHSTLFSDLVTRLGTVADEEPAMLSATLPWTPESVWPWRDRAAELPATTLPCLGMLGGGNE